MVIRRVREKERRDGSQREKEIGGMTASDKEKERMGGRVGERESGGLGGRIR